MLLSRTRIQSQLDHLATMLVRHFILSLTDDKLEIHSTPCTKTTIAQFIGSLAGKPLHRLWIRNRKKSLYRIRYLGERRSDASNQPHSKSVNLSQSSHFETSASLRGEC